METASVDPGEDRVSITGAMYVKELAPYLKRKLERGVQVVPQSGDKKKGKGSGGGDEKNSKESGDGDKKEGKEAPAPAVAEEEDGGDGGKNKDGCDGGEEVKAEGISPRKAEARHSRVAQGVLTLPTIPHGPATAGATDVRPAMRTRKPPP